MREFTETTQRAAIERTYVEMAQQPRLSNVRSAVWNRTPPKAFGRGARLGPR
jgi:hypothetical protein